VVRVRDSYPWGEGEEMKVREFFRFRWLRDRVMKLRDEYLNWKVRRAW